MPALSVIDLAMFLLETPERPFNIGPLIVLDPPVRGRDAFADRLSSAHAEAAAGHSLQLPAANAADRCALVGGRPERRPGRSPAPPDAAAAGQLRAAVRRRMRTARDAARPLQAAVGPVGHRRARRRQGGAVRQGAPRHHRRTYLRAGGVELARHFAHRSNGARALGRRAAPPARECRTRIDCRAAARRARQGDRHGHLDAGAVPHARRTGPAHAGHRQRRRPVAALRRHSEGADRQGLGQAKLRLLHAADSADEGLRQGPRHDAQRPAADHAGHRARPLPGRTGRAAGQGAGRGDAGGADRRRRRQPDRGAAVSARRAGQGCRRTAGRDSRADRQRSRAWCRSRPAKP